MHAAPSSITDQTADPTALPYDPAALVDEYLRILMIPDPDGARRFVAPDLQIRFTGGRPMRDPAECARFNAGRYAWVRKRFEGTELVSGATQECAVVYNRGTLYGAWPDGSPFEGNRYVDRYVIRHGLITQMDVWNDSAERMLARAGLATLDHLEDAAQPTESAGPDAGATGAAS
ncbi:nuclear transport factor 2 family protein [Herbaspirillum lusitanum]|uniref:Nuclear transport factor 2 family protein n=1 Tax=Herbaspirillum lusitanum TaxID=213312 RepID=A0ABW9A414_9BURK